jgi:hypothetical protein
MKVIFLFLSLVFDIYRWSLFLESSGEHNSPAYFKGQRSVLTKILIAVQVSISAFKTAIIVKVLEVGFT